MGLYICAGFILAALAGIILFNIRYNKERARLSDTQKRAEDDAFRRDTQLW